MANTPSVNADAAELMAALGLTSTITIEQAHAQGYYSSAEWAKRTGLSQDAVYRKFKESPDKVESVKVAVSGGPHYFRLKKSRHAR